MIGRSIASKTTISTAIKAICGPFPPKYPSIPSLPLVSTTDFRSLIDDGGHQGRLAAELRGPGDGGDQIIQPRTENGSNPFWTLLRPRLQGKLVILFPFCNGIRNRESLFATGIYALSHGGTRSAAVPEGGKGGDGVWTGIFPESEKVLLRALREALALHRK